MLDLYFQFSRKVGLPVQAENLAEERRSTEEEISRILRTECASYTRKCSACGKGAVMGLSVLHLRTVF